MAEPWALDHALLLSAIRVSLEETEHRHPPKSSLGSVLRKLLDDEEHERGAAKGAMSVPKKSASGVPFSRRMERPLLHWEIEGIGVYLAALATRRRAR